MKVSKKLSILEVQALDHMLLRIISFLFLIKYHKKQQVLKRMEVSWENDHHASLLLLKRVNLKVPMILKSSNRNKMLQQKDLNEFLMKAIIKKTKAIRILHRRKRLKKLKKKRSKNKLSMKLNKLFSTKTQMIQLTIHQRRLKINNKIWGN